MSDNEVGVLFSQAVIDAAGRGDIHVIRFYFLWDEIGEEIVHVLLSVGWDEGDMAEEITAHNITERSSSVPLGCQPLSIWPSEPPMYRGRNGGGQCTESHTSDSLRCGVCQRDSKPTAVLAAPMC